MRKEIVDGREYWYDDDGLCRRVRVPHLLMDGKAPPTNISIYNGRPGPIAVTDQKVADAYSEYVKRTTNAWHTRPEHKPPHDVAGPQPAPKPQQTTADANSAYEQYCSRIRNAWKGL